MSVKCPNKYYDAYFGEYMCKVEGTPCRMICANCKLDCDRAGRGKND